MDRDPRTEVSQAQPANPHKYGGVQPGKFEEGGEPVLLSGAESRVDPSLFEDNSPGVLTIGIIDCFRFSLECLAKALESLHPRLSILPFETPDSCLTDHPADLDLVIYYSHASCASETGLMEDVSAICRAFPSVPLVVLSDADNARQIKTFRNTLKSGAHGFIPTKTTGIPIALAAIRLVKEGGTFAPMDLVMASRQDNPRPLPEPVRHNPLTARQMSVLAHMQRGNANKIIAYELDMSESTVKVHVRNIMRKVGATNRTQAVYKAQRLLEGAMPGGQFERQ